MPSSHDHCKLAKTIIHQSLQCEPLSWLLREVTLHTCFDNCMWIGCTVLVLCIFGSAEHQKLTLMELDPVSRVLLRRSSEK